MIRCVSLTIAPTLVALLVGFGVDSAFAPLFAYFPPSCVWGLVCLSCVPLFLGLGAWLIRMDKPSASTAGDNRQGDAPPRPIHPATLILPLSVLLLFLCWPLGEVIASCIPPCCEVVARETTKQSAQAGFKAPFWVRASGWGNPHWHRFQLVEIHYWVHPNVRRHRGLTVILPEMSGYHVDEYPLRFPVTREKILEYVRENEDFTPEGAAVMAEELWAALRKYSELRHLPPMTYGIPSADSHEPLVYFVTHQGNYLGSSALVVLLISLPSFFLARWYCHYGN